MFWLLPPRRCLGYGLQDVQQLAYLQVLQHLASQADQISECAPSVKAVGILHQLGIELSRCRGDVPWWKRWIAQFTMTTIDSDIAYQPARYR